MYLSERSHDPTQWFRLHGSSSPEAFELKYSYLEADYRMFSHIFYAVKIQPTHVIILSAITDVFILGVYCSMVL